MSKSLLSYVEAGSGDTLVLIHGFCEDKTLWKDFSDVLSADYRVVCIDLPGFGDSEVCDGYPSTEVYAQSVHDLVVELKLAPFVVIGHSLGGYVTLAFAQLFPELLRGFGLFHSTVFADAADRRATREKAIEFVTNHGSGAYVATLIPKLFTEPNKIRFADRIAGLIEKGSAAPAQGIIDATVSMRDRKDRSQLLKDVKVPVLFIAGKEDTTVPLAQSEQQAVFSKNVRSYFLEDCAHMGMVEQPEQSLEAIQDFVEECYLKA